MTEVQHILPFQGETMKCIVCQKVQKADPKISLNWRAVDVDGYRYYACPDHFPPDNATAEEFEAAYMVIFNAIMPDVQLRKQLAERRAKKNGRVH